MGWLWRSAWGCLAVAALATAWVAWMGDSLRFAQLAVPLRAIGAGGTGFLLFTFLASGYDLRTGADRDRRNGTQLLLVLPGLVGLTIVAMRWAPALGMQVYLATCGAGVIGGMYALERDRERLRAGFGLCAGLMLGAAGLLMRLADW